MPKIINKSASLSDKNIAPETSFCYINLLFCIHWFFFIKEIKKVKTKIVFTTL